MKISARFLIAAAAMPLVFAAAPANASILFDFEEQSIAINVASISSTQGSLTVTITSDTTTTSVVRVSPQVVFGDRSIDPGSSAPVGDRQLILTFSEVIPGASIQFGDAGADTDTVTMTAYSGLNRSGIVLDTSTVVYDATRSLVNNDFGEISVAAAGIRSIIVDSVSSNGFGNSLFYDNLTVIPAPSALGLAGVAFGALVARRRH